MHFPKFIPGDQVEYVNEINGPLKELSLGTVYTVASVKADDTFITLEGQPAHAVWDVLRFKKIGE